jgi:putative membrane protein insertion efficiency factor
MNPLRPVVVASLRLYQRFVSPAFGPRCRYYPSCSEYAVQAVERFGVLRGSVLAVWRLLRCNPLSHGGVDPVEDQRLFSPKAAVPERAAVPDRVAVPGT